MAVQPILKWAGGKRWLVASTARPTPVDFKRYVEPFLGSGAMFFALEPSHAILSDLNAEIIELYSVIRDHPTELHVVMQHHQKHHSNEYYYQLRSLCPGDAVNRAARTLYLNRTCWNGLYRVNLKGEFNVPIGTKSSVLFNDENFLDVSRTLKSADLVCSDFQETIDSTREDDFLFVDPPYTVKHNMNGFLKYNERIFSWSDQIRLRDAVAQAIGRGVRVAVTNADHESVRALYAGLCTYDQLERTSILAGLSARRGRTTEALFTANLR